MAARPRPTAKAGPAARPAAKTKTTARATAATTTDAADWREQTLDRMRALVLQADPEIVEERKWRKPSNGLVGIPVWSRHGIICTGETYKNVVKLTFARGASLPDPKRLFNSSLEGNTRRAIDIHAGEPINAAAFKALVMAAVALNGASVKKPKTAR
ncbi:MAG: DUF1801 domain-containing protein [Singulisphaera sp.]